jgi:uncharacterized lipoprotein YddW (UPF0748 family)
VCILKRITAFFVLLALIVNTNIVFAGSTDMRGAWITTYYNLDFPSSTGLSAEQQKQEISSMIESLHEMGINTVIFQVRPCGDALYKSSINPWSQFLTGTEGKDPGYDPLAYAIQEAHKRGMELHAWLNPYRASKPGVTDINLLSANNMARLHPDWVFSYNNMLYYDPANSEVKQYLCDTVKEIITNYDVDAIHFDDYFYPSNYPLPSGETRDGDIANSRRDNINDLIKMVKNTINTYSPNVKFGVSPMGICKNTTVDGFTINGTQSYYSDFADSETWVKNGWVDYICPQVYWEIDNKAAAYDKVAKMWNNIVAGTGVKLYIGEAVYKNTVASEMSRHFDVCSKLSNVSGNVFFRAKYLINNTGDIVSQLKNEYSKNSQTSNYNNKSDICKRVALSTSSQVMVDGVKKNFEAYNINGYNYFKLRDLAYVLNGTQKQFDTEWDENKNAITLDLGTAYNAAGGELSAGNGENKAAIPSSASVYINGKALDVEAYNIDGMNYYKLRDIAKAVDFGVVWDEQVKTIGIFSMYEYN